MPRQLLAPTGWLVAIALAGWLSGPSGEGVRTRPLLLLAAGAAGSLAAGSALPRRLVPLYGLATAVVVAVVVLTASEGLSGGALAGPLGYGNANGALCAQGAAAAMIPLLVSRSTFVRTMSLSLAALLVALAWATQSAAGLAGALLCVLVPLPLALSRRSGRTTRPCQLVAAAAAAGTAAALLVTVALGATYDAAAPRDDALGRVVDRTLTERRVVLWSEALEMLAEHPGEGVGFGRFDEVSMTAIADEDARWAHSGFLQFGAETGVFGLFALLGLTGWVFLALFRTCRRSRLPVVGACAAAAVLGQATIDYVLHFPSVPVVALATVGVCLRHDRPARTVAI